MSILDDAIAGLQNAVSSAGSVTQNWSSEWDTARANLIAKAQEFSQLWNGLIQQGPVAASDPALQADYDALMTRGNYIRSTVQSITQGFDTGADWFNNTLSTFRNAIGLGGVPRVGMSSLMRMGGLGLLPLVPVAVIAAAIAAVTYWITDAYVMKNRLDLAAKVQAAGGDPSGVLNAGSVFGSLQGISKNAMILGVVAAFAVGIYAWPEIKKHLR